MKKVICFLLAAITLLSLLPVSAVAAREDEQSVRTAEAEIMPEGGEKEDAEEPEPDGVQDMNGSGGEAAVYDADIPVSEPEGEQDGAPEVIIPDTPEIYSIDNSGGNIKIKWEKTEGASGYSIYRSTDGKSYKFIKDSQGDSFTNVSVKTGVRYYYKIRAFYETDEKREYTDYSKVKSAIAVKTTTITSAVETKNNVVTVKWEAVPGADKYRLYRRAPGEDFIYYGMVSGTEYKDDEVKVGETYTYRIRTMVRAEGVNNYSSYSNELSTTLMERPDITSISSENGRIRVWWSLPEGAVGYNIYRSTDGKSFEFITYSEGKYFTNVSVKTGVRYYYKAAAVYEDENGEKITSGLGAAKSAIAVKTAVINSVEETDDDTITVSWDKVPGADKYRVYKKTGDGDFEFVAMISENRYVDRQIRSGETYTYRIRTMVRAEGVNNYSSYSNEVSETVRIRPEITKIDTAGGNLTVKWSAVPGASGYKIYRSTDGKSYKFIKDTPYLSFKNVSVKSGVRYYYKIAAVFETDGGTVNSGRSWAESAVTVKTPSMKKCSTDPTGGIKITWEPVSGASRYKIYRQTGNESFVYYDIASGKGYVDTGIVPGVKYTYRIKAMAKEGGDNYYSEYSNTLSGSVKKGPQITKVYRNNSGLRVEWKSLSGAVSYNVLRSEDGGKTFELVRENSPYLGFTNACVQGGIKYYYRVVAKMKDGTYTCFSASKCTTKETTVDRVLAVAAGEVGNLEDPRGSNFNKYNTWYYGWRAGGPEHPWCLVFVQWVFAHADFELPLMTASCTSLMNYAKSHGMWVTGDYRPGDIVLFNTDDDPYPEHSAIVEAVRGEDWLVCIEGNTSLTKIEYDDGVYRKNRSTENIMGAIRPNY